MHFATKRYQAKLKDIIATQKQIIGKRNQTFSKLKNRLYDVTLMFDLMAAFRNFEEQWFNNNYSYKDSKLEVADFFILLHALNAGDFWATDVQPVIDNIPERLVVRKNYKAENGLMRMKKLGLVRYFTPDRRERKWFITPEGKWFLMQRTKELRMIFLDCLTRDSKPRRRLIIGGKKI